MKKHLFLLLAIFGITQPAFSIICSANEKLTQPVENQCVAAGSASFETGQSASSHSFFKKKNGLANRLFSFKKMPPKNAGKPLTVDGMARFAAVFGVSGVGLFLLAYATAPFIFVTAAISCWALGIIFGAIALGKGTNRRAEAIIGIIPGAIVLVFAMALAWRYWFLGDG